MDEWINTFLFGIYPYICLSVFLIASVIRFDREQYTWRSQSSQLLRRRELMWGSNLFHVGILVILFGHTGGLLTPVVFFEALGARLDLRSRSFGITLRMHTSKFLFVWCEWLRFRTA